MRKMVAGCLLLALLLSLCGCNESQPKSETTVPSAAEQETTLSVQSVETECVETQPPQTEPPISDAHLFLKVSSITFSVVGESEDIYLGLVPREEVTWESENPEIVSVENGVLTANAVGTTTIRATYADQQVQCSAGCLAKDQQELESLGFDILSQPKRVLPEVDMEAPCAYFEDAALVGDSIAYMMMRCENAGDYLGGILFMTRGGTSLNGFVRRSKNISYRGTEMNLEDAIAQSKVKRVYILIGSNDLPSPPQREVYMDNWATMLDRIWEKSPDVQIVILSNIPQYAGEQACQGEQFVNYNRLVREYNEKLRQFAQENGCLYLDLYYYIQDHCGRMPQKYNLDGYHLNDEGYQQWMKFMRYYAQYELEGGTLA